MEIGKIGKKGELTTAQLVTIIILITSFVIILVFIFMLNLGQITEREICHNSVILRGQSDLTAGPLDCKTQYTTIDGESKQPIMNAMANEMEDCWYTFGEGKINYGTKELVENRVEYAVCSVVEFSEEAQEAISTITYRELYNHLQETERKNTGRSYLHYFYGVDSLESLQIEDEFTIELDNDVIATSERYSIITGIDNNPTPVEDVVLKVYIVPTSELSSRLEENREFITKA